MKLPVYWCRYRIKKNLSELSETVLQEIAFNYIDSFWLRLALCRCDDDVFVAMLH